MRKRLFFLSVIFCLFSFVPASHAVPDTLTVSAVRHNGRVKPFEAAARQTLKLLSGSERWDKKDAAAILSDALSHPEKLEALKWIRIDFFELKSTLGLSREAHFFSMKELAPKAGLVQSLAQSAKKKRDADLRPSKLEQKAEQLYVKMRTVEELAAGNAIAVLTPGSKEADPSRLSAEIIYFRLKPFEWAALGYFLAFLFLGPFRRTRALSPLGWVSLFAAVGFHTAGLGLRVFVLSRPPVTNMYESMIFMNWALMIMALVFSLVKKSIPVLSAGAFVSGLVMVYANLLPIDPSLDVLVPVLRSNYWLSVHVMTVVSSYGAFGLAMGLGHRHLALSAMNQWNEEAAKESASLIFKVIQLGVILIGTGTFLGGVWANESWGRFWGWDPKETWAFITFLGYLIVVHLRYARKINDFYLALSTIVGFQLVLMTWYGVNFVLGRGLHSYGAGSGGMAWVVYFLVFEAAFLTVILAKARIKPSR